jgi:uncharacterized protein YndB with AHSA1/START domain
MSAEPTGRRETRGFGEAVVFDRRFSAGIDDVWASITRSDRLERWVGVWEGDPASGRVVFRMTAEGDDVAPEAVTIHECAPPRTLRMQIGGRNGGADAGQFELALDESGGVTTLTFAQSAVSDHPIADVAPGWEYYLDRLVADHEGADASTVDFDDYYPSMREHYRAMFE